MIGDLLIIGSLFAAAGLAYWLSRRIGSERKLVGAEVPVTAEIAGYPLVGRIDRVYQNPDGSLVVCDIKTRQGKPVVHDSDLTQVSIYAAMLRQSGKNVAPHGLVHFVDRETGDEAEKPVALLDDVEVSRIVADHAKSMSSPTPPMRLGQGATGKCRVCAQAARCWHG